MIKICAHNIRQNLPETSATFSAVIKKALNQKLRKMSRSIFTSTLEHFDECTDNLFKPGDGKSIC